MERDWQVTAILPGGIYIETDCNSGEQRRIEKVSTPKAERQRLLARNRKRRQRARQREHKARMGARTLSFEIYQGTDQALKELCQLAEFQDASELLTHLIHQAHKLAKRDLSRFQHFVSFKESSLEHV